MEIKVGQIIRSYDFPGMKGEYMEGRVLHTHLPQLEVKTTKIVRGGVEADASEHPRFLTCHPGDHILDDTWEGRIEILQEADPEVETIKVLSETPLN